MTSAEEIGRNLKEKLCAFGYDTKLKLTAESSDKNQTCGLSDGNIISVGAGGFRRARLARMWQRAPVDQQLCSTIIFVLALKTFHSRSHSTHNTIASDSTR